MKMEPTYTLDSIIEITPKIKPDRKYWLVRTQAGYYYEDFKANGYIAIGYNEITLEDIHIANQSSEGMDRIAAKIAESYEDNARPVHTIKQLIKFAYDIEKCDIVLIPSENSEYITFGEVIETPSFYYNLTLNKPEEPYRKRKKIKWLKTVKRDKLDANLYKLLFSHHTITEASSYAPFIDRTLSDFFIKGKEAHLVLDVTTKEGIVAKELFEMGNVLFKLVDEFSFEENLNINTNHVEIKLNLQSPGTLELIGMTIEGLTIMGLLFVTLAGGSFETNNKVFPFKFHTDGLIVKLNQFLNGSTQRKVMADALKESMKDLKIKDPEDLKKLLEILSDRKPN